MTGWTGCTGTRHGDVNAYRTYGCKCPEAIQAGTRYRTLLRLDHLHGIRHTVDATGTQRRLQALTAIGWSDADLGARLGITRSGLYMLRSREQVYLATRRQVAGLYEQLAETPGGSSRAINRARRNGWLEPKWWDSDLIDDPAYTPPTKDRRRKTDVDPVAVDLACAGRVVTLTRAERLTAVSRLRQQGASLSEIAERLRTSQRHVTRDLARMAS